MRFLKTRLEGAMLIVPERHEDERGFFARTWCREEFASHGLRTDWVQFNVSFNRRRGTLRGLHYQAEPHPECKLVRCTRGAVWDVIVDLRPDSPTCTDWVAVELTADNRNMLYIPQGFAHGFQTLTDDTELFYQMSEFYHPELARGVRWDDPVLAIGWPWCPERIISPRDLAFPVLPCPQS
jgi:dTDP-4-dehydrorhamnose 3,5-epimerase